MLVMPLVMIHSSLTQTHTRPYIRLITAHRGHVTTLTTFLYSLVTTDTDTQESHGCPVLSLLADPLTTMSDALGTPECVSPGEIREDALYTSPHS